MGKQFHPLWDVITHPCSNFKGGLNKRTWCRDETLNGTYISPFYMDEITYLRLGLDTDLANLLNKRCFIHDALCADSEVRISPSAKILIYVIKISS